MTSGRRPERDLDEAGIVDEQRHGLQVQLRRVQAAPGAQHVIAIAAARTGQLGTRSARAPASSPQPGHRGR